MADDSGEEKDTKRQRVLDPAEQRATFVEDMERIRAAMNGASGAPTEAEGEGEEEEEKAAESTMQQQQSQQPYGSFTTQQQQLAQGGGQSKSTGVLDSDDDEEGNNNWLQNYTPHHTRVGSNYQVADLPPVSSHNDGAAARSSDTISGRVSPTSGGSGEG